MKPVTREMVRQYQLRKLGYDFMGYNIHNIEHLSFHHLIVPKRDCKSQGLGDGYYQWNGAILVQETSHEYLHTIERIDREKFLEITRLMIKQNRNGRLDIEHLKQIRQVLLAFESEHKQDTGKKGKLLIKRQYIQDRIELSQ